MKQQSLSETLTVMIKTESKDPILVLHLFKVQTSQKHNTYTFKVTK